MPSLREKAYAHFSPNLGAAAIVRQMIKEHQKLQIEVASAGEATLIDCGIKVKGSLEAGRLFASACLGGLAEVKLGWFSFGDWQWPAVEVITDHPLMACLASQYAGWFVKQGKFSAMGSGPARALAAVEDLFSRLNYRDEAETGVIALETRKLPGEEIAAYVASKCNLDPASLYVLAAPTASLVGSVQIAARAVETGLHKLMELGYPLDRVVSGWGICPLPPVAADDLEALGRTNDAVLYGSIVHYVVADQDQALAEEIKKIPSSASKDYGQPFGELFKRYGDFYSIDPLLFSPAEVRLTNLTSGRTFRAGKIRPDILAASFRVQE